MKKNNYKIILLIYCFILIINCSKKELMNNEKYDNSVNYIESVIVKRGSIENYLEYSASLVAEKESYISPSISGRVGKIFVNEGDFVREGDILVKMDEAQLIQTKAQYENAKNNFERMKKLLETGTIDQQAYETAETMYKVAKANYDFISTNTEIKAPFDGIISMKLRNESDNYNSMMPSGNTPEPAIMKLIKIDNIKAIIQVSNKDIVKVKKGQKVKIFVDAYTDKIFIGKINFISPEANNLSNTFKCEVIINNKDKLLKPGMIAKAEIILNEKNNVLIVPQNSIVNNDTLYYIKNGRAYKKKVKLGIQNKDNVEIIEGVGLNDSIVYKGNLGLIDGSLVVEKK